MAQQVRTDAKVFGEINYLLEPRFVKGRTKSASFLIWFLETVFRLDEVGAQDAVCDRQHDAGFDAIFVDDNSEQVVVFQCKHKESLPATLGDTDLKEFYGSLAQLSSGATVSQLVDTTKNLELKSLLVDQDVAKKVDRGYQVRAIFLTNVAANSDAHAYLTSLGTTKDPIQLWDSVKLTPIVKQTQKEWFIDEKFKFTIDDGRAFYVGDKKQEPELVYASISALELVKLPGIEDSRLFAQNVRLGLGNTRINREIVESVRSKKQHKDFLFFHNGLTIATQSIKRRGKSLTIEDFSVCNGCQSLVSFFENKKHLTASLEVPVRFVKVSDKSSRVAALIAYRSNNQNAVSLKDLSSNKPTQVALKNEFDELFGNRLKLSIKTGEDDEKKFITNEYGGRLLLALYSRRPWETHQKYRIFGDLEYVIFTHETGAPQLMLAHLLFERTKAALPLLKNVRMSKYSLTAYLLLFLLGETLRLSVDGKELLANPLLVLSTANKPNPEEVGAMKQIDALLSWLILELEDDENAPNGDNFDYKRIYKSQKSAQEIWRNVEKAFKKDIPKKRVSAYGFNKQIPKAN